VGQIALLVCQIFPLHVQQTFLSLELDTQWSSNTLERIAVQGSLAGSYRLRDLHSQLHGNYKSINIAINPWSASSIGEEEERWNAAQWIQWPGRLMVKQARAIYGPGRTHITLTRTNCCLLA